MRRKCFQWVFDQKEKSKKIGEARVFSSQVHQNVWTKIPMYYNMLGFLLFMVSIFFFFPFRLLLFHFVIFSYMSTVSFIYLFILNFLLQFFVLFFFFFSFFVLFYAFHSVGFFFVSSFFFFWFIRVCVYIYIYIPNLLLFYLLGV